MEPDNYLERRQTLEEASRSDRFGTARNNGPGWVSQIAQDSTAANPIDVDEDRRTSAGIGRYCTGNHGLLNSGAVAQEILSSAHYYQLIATCRDATVAVIQSMHSAFRILNERRSARIYDTATARQIQIDIILATERPFEALEQLGIRASLVNAIRQHIRQLCLMAFSFAHESWIEPSELSSAERIHEFPLTTRHGSDVVQEPLPIPNQMLNAAVADSYSTQMHVASRSSGNHYFDLLLHPYQSVWEEPSIPLASRETNPNLQMYAAPYPGQIGYDPVRRVRPALALSTASRPSASFLSNDHQHYHQAGPVIPPTGLASQQPSVSSPNQLQMQAQHLTQGHGSRIGDLERNMRYRPY